MGSGFKDFAAGDILTAADVDGYLMRQTVMTFADASARDSALSGVLDEGMMAYLEDTNRTTYYDGSAWQDIAKSSSIGTWTTYTPSWTGSGGTPTIGNGTLTGKYLRINNVVMGSVIMTLGSTSSIAGISEWRWSYPSGLSPANTVTYQALGSGFTIDAGTAGYRSTVYHLAATMAVHASDGAGTVGAAVPFTWTPANGDLVSFSFAYEVA